MRNAFVLNSGILNNHYQVVTDINGKYCRLLEEAHSSINPGLLYTSFEFFKLILISQQNC